MPASAEDLKARVRRAQRQARRERARQRALLGPGWGLARDAHKTEALRQALDRPGGPGGGGWEDPEIAGILLAQEKLRKAAEIERKAKQRPLTPAEYHEHERLVWEAKRERYRVADTGKAGWETLIEVLAGPATASWLPGGTPRHGSWKDFAIEGGLAAAGVVPIGRVVGLGARGARAAGIPTRTIAARGFQATIPAARSRLVGRPIERVIDRLRPERWTLRRIAAEIQRGPVKTAAIVKGGSGQAAINIARRLNAGQMKAIQLLNDEAPVAAHVTRHRGWLDDAIRAGDKEAQYLHGIQLRLIDQASRWIDDSSGVPVLRATAPEKLREAWRLTTLAGDTRSEIVRQLGVLTDLTMAERLSKPGRVMLGAEWFSEGKAADEIGGVRAFYGGAREVTERGAAADIRGAKRWAGEAGKREIAAAEQAERLAAAKVGSPAAGANAAAARAMDARAAARGRIARLQASLGRAETRLEAALTDPVAGAADAARRIQAVTSTAKRLRAEKDRLRRLVREGAEIAREQELYEGVARQEAERVMGRLRAAVVSIHAAHGSKGAAAAHAARVAAQADDELARLAASEKALIEAIQEKAGTLVGAEHFTGGRTFVPDVRGVPGVRPRTVRSLIRQSQVTVRAAFNRRALSGRPTAIDQGLSHEYTGLLRQSGLYRTDAPNLVGESLARALKLDTIRTYRDMLIPAGSKTPRSLTDVPIALKPGSAVPDDLRRLWDKWEQVEAGGLTRRQIDDFGADREAVEFLRQLFPKNLPVEEIEGVVWVPRELFRESAFVTPFAARYGDSILAELAATAPKLFQDYVKAAILFTNPAYGPVQLVQNVALNVIDQGVFAPVNWARAARMLARVKPETKQALLEMMEASGSAAVLRPSRAPIDWAARLMMFIADRYPRMASFVHAARKHGIRTPAEVDALVDATRAGNKGALEKLDLIRRSAVDAVGDFERLGPMEKAITANFLFVYPWVKAATRLTYRMPLEHPYQAGAFGYAGYRLHERSDEILGDRPHYAQFEIPIPGQFDESGNPYTVNIARLFPWETPANLARAGAAIATGEWQEGPQLLDQLQPVVQSAITALTGRDDFGREVGKGIPTLARELQQAMPVSRFIEGFTTPDADKQDKLYPRDTGDEIVRLAAGSLAPKPYNTEKGQTLASGRTRTPSSYVRQAMREARSFSQKHPDLLHPGWLPAVEQALTIRAAVSDEMFRLRKSVGAKNLTERQEYAAKLTVLQKRRPELGIGSQEWEVFRLYWERATYDELQQYKTLLNGLLELEDVHGLRVLGALSRAREQATKIERDLVAQTAIVGR